MKFSIEFFWLLIILYVFAVEGKNKTCKHSTTINTCWLNFLKPVYSHNETRESKTIGMFATMVC